MGSTWQLIERFEDGEFRQLLVVDGEEYLHLGPDDPDLIEARVEQIQWDRIVDHLTGDRR